MVPLTYLSDQERLVVNRATDVEQHELGDSILCFGSLLYFAR